MAVVMVDGETAFVATQCCDMASSMVARWLAQWPVGHQWQFDVVGDGGGGGAGGFGTEEAILRCGQADASKDCTRRKNH